MAYTNLAVETGFRTVAGAAAGNLTVTGITTKDKLLCVVRVDAAGANLASEFTITADNTINNAGGTSTATGVVLVVWAKAHTDGASLNEDA